MSLSPIVAECPDGNFLANGLPRPVSVSWVMEQFSCFVAGSGNESASGRIGGQGRTGFDPKLRQMLHYLPENLIGRQIAGVYVQVCVYPGVLQATLLCRVPAPRPADIWSSDPLLLKLKGKEYKYVRWM